MPGFGFGFGFGKRGARRRAAAANPYAGYALAMPFKTNGPYIVNGTSYATLASVPGYSFADSVDNIPNIDATGYTSLTAEASLLKATANPFLTDVDFVIWAVADFQGQAYSHDNMLADIGGWQLFRGVGAQIVAYTGTYHTGSSSVTGRAVILLRRRGSKWTLGEKKGSTVTVAAEEGVSGFGTISEVAFGSTRAGGLRADAPLEGVFGKLGTFSDADLTAILQAA